MFVVLHVNGYFLSDRSHTELLLGAEVPHGATIFSFAPSSSASMASASSWDISCTERISAPEIVTSGSTSDALAGMTIAKVIAITNNNAVIFFICIPPYSMFINQTLTRSVYTVIYHPSFLSLVLARTDTVASSGAEILKEVPASKFSF